MLRLPEKAVRKILVNSSLYTAATYAGKRDVYLARARVVKQFCPEEILTVSMLMRDARLSHRQYWKAMKRVHTADVIPFRIPLLQAGGMT